MVHLALAYGGIGVTPLEKWCLRFRHNLARPFGSYRVRERVGRLFRRNKGGDVGRGFIKRGNGARNFGVASLAAGNDTSDASSYDKYARPALGGELGSDARNTVVLFLAAFEEEMKNGAPLAAARRTTRPTSSAPRARVRGATYPSGNLTAARPRRSTG